MRLVTTLDDFSRYYDNYEDRIRAVHAAGFRYIDIDIYTRPMIDRFFLCDGWEANTERIAATAAELGMTFVQAHSPGGNPLKADGNHEWLMQATVRSLEVCQRLGIPHIVVHAGFGKDMSKKTFFEQNRVYYYSLLPTMERTGVEVLIENGMRSDLDGSYYLQSGAEMREFVEYLRHPMFHLCWDTGHANIAFRQENGHQYRDILDMGSELHALHINDNRGFHDEHHMPYFGTVNMDEIMHGLIDSGYSGHFTLESTYTAGERNEAFGIPRHTFERDTRLYKEPIELKLKTEKLLYETARCILNAYGLWEE